MLLLYQIIITINCWHQLFQITSLFNQFTSLLALNCSCPNFFWNVLQVWMTGKHVYLQMTWSWPDKTWNILCSYCLQWNTSQSKFRNHYFLFYLRFPYCPTFSDLGLYVVNERFWQFNWFEVYREDIKWWEKWGEMGLANDASFTRHSSQVHRNFCPLRTPTSSPPLPVYSLHIFSSTPWLLSLSQQSEIRRALLHTLYILEIVKPVSFWVNANLGCPLPCFTL